MATTLQDVAVAVGRLDERQEAAEKARALVDATNAATLARIEAKLDPLAKRVDELERFKGRAKYAAVGLAMMALSNLTGIKSDLVISILEKVFS